MENIINIIKKADKLMGVKEITRRMNLHPSQQKMVKTLLERLSNEGKLIKKKGLYCLPQSEGLMEGVVCSTISGADFFMAEGLKEDLKIVHSREFMLMHNDRVLVKVLGKNCRVIKVIRRAYTEIVGTVVKEGSTYFLVPDEKKLHTVFILPKSNGGQVQVGDKAVCQITSYPTNKSYGVCKVLKNLGSSENESTAILSVLYKYGIEQNFPKEVIDACRDIPKSVSEEDLYNRLDLRKLTVITIDGEDAKDLDDAVSLEITEKGEYLLGVHIADVSHYVLMDSPIDKQACLRATSVYIPGTVYPMLPKELSNGICSLNEKVDRLTISCFMLVSKQGKVVDYSIQPSVINSKHRMNYSDVTDILENSKSPKRKEYKDILGMLLLMKELALILINGAKKRGSIDFDLPEAKVILDENDFPVDIQEYEIGISNKIIEQFMLLANKTVAKHMVNKALPSIYRVHEKPDEKKLESFKEVLKPFNIFLKDDPKPQDFNDILNKVKDTPEEALIKKTMLRSMSKAKYKPTNDGHFGLAYEYYLHFTSPIRRYPDLMVHRALNMWFLNNQGGLKSLKQRLENTANVSTLQEINAAMCERDVTDIRKAQYMSKHIGEEFFGIVSGVTAYGIFVELPNTVEGFVPISTMDGYFDFDEANYRLKSDSKCYRLGDNVKIRVFSADTLEGKVDFTLLA
ncbi:MAG: ribonuclease R [Clostridiales bacterium]|nr:ribonuclease R [Clostridiales bacterium]